MGNVAPIRGKADPLNALDRFVEAIDRLVVAVDQLRAELRREQQRAPNTGRLFDEIEAYFGIGGRFTAGGLLMRAEQDARMADALALVIDMNLPGRAVALGRLLAREPRVRAVARRGNAVVYVLTEATEATQPV